MSPAARDSFAVGGVYVILAGLCFSCALLMFSLSRTFWVSLAVIAVGGWGLVSYLAAANSYIQVKVPDELRGRVMSVYSFVFLGLVPVGNSIMGTFADRAGTTTAVATGAIICIGASFMYAWKYLLKGRRVPEAGRAE